MKKSIFLLLALFLLFLCSSAQAIPIQGITFGSQVTADVDVSFEADSYVPEFDAYFENVDSLTFSFTNNSTIPASITGFAFNLPGDTIIKFYLEPDDTMWEGDVEYDSFSAPMGYGPFDAGASTDLKNFKINGGTVYPDGIMQGQSMDIVFYLLNPDGFNGNDFISAMFPSLDQDPGFVVRFQGVGPDGEWSDVGVPVPEPATMLLFGSGLLCLAGIGRKKFLSK